MTLEHYQTGISLYSTFNIKIDTNDETYIPQNTHDYVTIEGGCQTYDTPLTPSATIQENVNKLKDINESIILTIRKITSINDEASDASDETRQTVIRDILETFYHNIRREYGWDAITKLQNARKCTYKLVDEVNLYTEDNPYREKFEDYVDCGSNGDTYRDILNNCDLFKRRPNSSTTHHIANSDNFSSTSNIIENYNNLWLLNEYVQWLLNIYVECGVLAIFYHIQVLPSNDCVYIPSADTYYPEGSEHIVWSESHSEHFLEEDCCHVDQDQDWYPRDECTYCDDCDEWIHENSECNTCENKTSKDTHRINDYHDSPQPCFRGILTELDNDYLSKLRAIGRFSIGFEVEKVDVDGKTNQGDSISPQPFFAGWETDSSCGVEGISNIYSLEDYVNISKDIDNSPYIDEDTDIKCGGHINIHDYSDKLSYWHLSPFMGLFYALWRYRLKRDYCGNNKKLNPYQNGTHYNVIAEKSNCGTKLYEIRIPSAVKNRQQLKLRYQLMQNFMECVNSYMQEDFSYMTAIYDYNEQYCPDRKINILVKDLLHSEYFYNSDKVMQMDTPTYQRCRFVIAQTYPILREMYKNNQSSLPTIIMLTYAFQTWLDGNNRTEPTTSIRQYIHN